MTAKRDSKRKPKSDKEPKLKKESLRDLNPNAESAGRLRGGAPRPTVTEQQTGCPS
jgi:hypothetical protein